MGAKILDRLDARSLLAIMLLGGVMSLAFLLAINDPASDTFKILLGGLMTTGFAGVIQWYYGSSSGSAMKDEALTKAAAVQNETIAKQSDALAQSTPVTAGQTTTTTVDAKAGTAETVTEPAKPEAADAEKKT